MANAACGDGPKSTPTLTVTTVTAPATTPTALRTPPPTAIATATPLPAAVKDIVPSMVEIRIRDTGVGSGFVGEGGYIVTAAHVAWPYTAVGIVFEDGTEYANVPVVSYDHLADLAILGPIDTAAPHVELVNIETMSEGDTVFVFGYPEERLGLSFTNGEFEYSWDWADADINRDSFQKCRRRVETIALPRSRCRDSRRYCSQRSSLPIQTRAQ